jgi:hypothetical protein
MFSLMIFAVIGTYFFLVWFVAWLFRRIALSTGKSKSIGRWAAMIGALIVLLPVFWDVPPTMAAHRYYCAKDAGVWVYKTPKQWYAERIGKASKSPPIFIESQSDKNNFFDNIPSFSRLGLKYDSYEERKFLTVTLTRRRIVDVTSGEVLVETRNYSAWPTKPIPHWKWWLSIDFCHPGLSRTEYFLEIYKQIEKLAGEI